MLRQRLSRAIPNRWSLLRRFRRDTSGATAIEFAMVFTPFLMLIFAIFGVSLFYISETILDRSLTAASRQIRTGQSQSANLSIVEFKNQICNNSGGLIDCAKLSIMVLNEENWADITPPSCIDDDGNLAGSSHQDDAAVSEGAGGRERVVLVVACYPWPLLASLPYLGLGNVNGNQAQLISAVTAFKSEPY